MKLGISLLIRTLVQIHDLFICSRLCYLKRFPDALIIMAILVSVVLLFLETIIVKSREA